MRLFATWLLFAACLLGSAASDAATLAERSPVRLGLWWDPQHDGSGFEIFRAGDGIALIWYTYRADGAPIWYAAAGSFDADGSWESALHRHAWRDGAAVDAAVVGALKLRREHPELLQLEWTLDGRAGTQTLQPYAVSGIVPEIDHSGAWFDPLRPGFGLGVTEQGTWLAATLYFYDASGVPTWRLGDNAGRGPALTLRGFSGTCPGCTALEAKTIDEGRLQLQLGDERTLHARYEGAATAAWALDGSLTQISLPASARPADRQLASFEGEPTLRRWLDDALVNAPLRWPPVVDFSPAPLMTTYSATNLQEAGVDEADRMKSDGRWLYAIARGEQGGDRPAVRVAEVRDEGAHLVLHGERALPASESAGIGHSGLFLTERHLVSLQGTVPGSWGGDPLWSTPVWWTYGSTRVALFDRADPAAPERKWSAEFDGHLVASRRIGDTLHLVLRQTTQVPGLDSGSTPDALRARLAATATEKLLPQVRFDEGAWQSLVQPSQVHLPVIGSLQPSPEFITLVSLQLAPTPQWKAMAVVGAVSAVYVSPQRMYIATARSASHYDAQLGFRPQGFQVTDVHEIALGGDGPAFTASGTLEGYLDRDPDRAVFRFSEKDGRLRVITVGEFGTLGRNRLTVLERSTIAPGLLRTLSTLPNRDRPAPLGKPDEMLYGTRFVGDRLYAVTFLKTDPLYVVDLARPEAPAIVGELELPGFSDYLHPVGDNLLLGVGLDASPAQSGWGDNQFAWFQGLLFSLFDVADPSRPRLLQQQRLGKRGSTTALLRNHHALSELGVAGGVRFGVPVRVHDADAGTPPSPPADFTYPWAWSGLQTLEVQGTSAVDARLVPGFALVTHRRAGAFVEHYPDDAALGARAVQFPRGIVYVEQGRFWRADLGTSTVSGPF